MEEENKRQMDYFHSQDTVVYKCPSLQYSAIFGEREREKLSCVP